MLMMNPRSRPFTPVRVRSPDSITMTQSPGSSARLRDLDVADAGKHLQGRGRGIAIDEAHLLAEMAERVRHGKLRPDRVAVRAHVGRQDEPAPLPDFLDGAGTGARVTRCRHRSGVAIVRAGGFLFVKVAEDLFDAVLVLDRLVEPELDFGNPAQADARADLAAEERRRPLQRLLRLDPLLRIAERGVEDLGDLEVGRDLHARERDEADARVVDVAAGQHLAQFLADLIPDTIRTVALRHKKSESFEPFDVQRRAVDDSRSVIRIRHRSTPWPPRAPS